MTHMRVCSVGVRGRCEGGGGGGGGAWLLVLFEKLIERDCEMLEGAREGDLCYVGQSRLGGGGKTSFCFERIK